MNFIEAMVALLDGAKVRRVYWPRGAYIRIERDCVVCHEPRGAPFRWRCSRGKPRVLDAMGPWEIC